VVFTELRLSRMPCADTEQQEAVTIPTAIRIGRARLIPIPIQPLDYGCLDIISAALMVYFFLKHSGPPPLPMLSPRPDPLIRQIVA
jgi:hypothetical protein